MITFKHFILSVLVFLTLRETTGLIELSEVEDNYILRTDSILRDITNKVFTALKLKGITERPIANHYSLIHHYFVSLTLQDYTSLKQIAKLSRVNKTQFNNTTKNLVNTINSIINTEFNVLKTSDINENATKAFNYTDHIVNYIDSRLKELEYLQVHSANSPRVDINKDILSVLNDEAQVWNGSNKIEEIFENQADNNTEDDDSDFWKPDALLSGRRIFHGKRTKIKYFPFMASIEIFQKFTCGGSILSNDLIITAASCLQLAWNNRLYRENPAFLSVRVGSNYYNGGGEVVPVLELFFHPSYNPMTLSNNIVIVRLHRQLKFKKNKEKYKIKKIDFDRRESPLPMNVDGVTIVGWGALTTKNTVSSPWVNKISFAILEVYPLDECQNIYTKQYVKHTNFCAGFISKGTGACNKDVGGPGLVAGVLTGIISFGSPACGTPDSPTVFTKVGYYADWIEEVFEKVKNSPYIRRQTTIQTTPYHPYYTLGRTKSKISSVVPVTVPNREPIIRQPPEQQKAAPPNEIFNQFLKTMFNTEEIEEYLDLNAQDKETDLKNAQIIEERKEQIEDTFPLIHPFTPIDTDTVATPSILRNQVAQNYKTKRNFVTTRDLKTTPSIQKHIEKHELNEKYEKETDNLEPKNKKDIHITKLDYNNKRYTKKSQQYILYDIPPESEIKYTAIGSASTETTDRFYRYTDFTRRTKIPMRDKSHKFTSVDIEPRSKHVNKTKSHSKSKPQKEESVMFKNNENGGDESDDSSESIQAVNSLDISNDKYSEGIDNDKSNKYDIDVFDHDNEGIKVFDENDIIETDELDINMGNDNERYTAQKAIDELLNDDVLGAKFIDDENQEIEEIEDYDGDIQFDENDLEKVETQEDYKDGIMLPEDLADLTFRKDNNGTFGELSEKIIFEILSEFIAAQTQNLTADNL